MAVSLSRERFLEQKISMLDKRLTLVERFVELRFKEAFQSFLTTTDDPDDIITGCDSQDNVEFEFSKNEIFNTCDGSGSRDEVFQLQKVRPGVKKKRVGANQHTLPGPSKKRFKKSQFLEGPSEGDCIVSDMGVLGEDYIKVPCCDTTKKDTDNNSVKIKSQSELHVMNESYPSAKDDRMESQRAANQNIVTVAGTYADVNYMEFTGTRTVELEDVILRSAVGVTKRQKEILRKESPTTPPVYTSLMTETPTTGRNSIRRRQQNRKPSETKSEPKDTPPKTNEATDLKKRVYAPALCSTLPSIARADPTRKECPMCHMHIKNELFEAHKDAHVKERHLKCPFCEKRYFNQSMLRKHRMIHQPEKYGKKCRICEKLFFQGDKKLAHERFCVKRALERKDFVNPEIIQDLKNRSPGWTAEEEPATYTDPLELKECPHCHKMFKANFYQRHLKMHTQTKHWACNLCDKEYFHKHDLVRHFVAEHRSPMCDLCSKTFKDKVELMDHIVDCRKNHKTTKSSRPTTKTRQEVRIAAQPVETAKSKEPKNVTVVNEPVLEAVEKLTSEPNFSEDGGTVTLLSEEIIVVSNDVEVSQLGEQSHSIILVEEELETPSNQ